VTVRFDIGDPDVLATLAAGIGLDPAAFRADLDAGTYQAAHPDALAEATERHITAVRTLFVGRHALYAVNRHVTFTPYRATFGLAECEVDTSHWSRRGRG